MSSTVYVNGNINYLKWLASGSFVWSLSFVDKYMYHAYSMYDH